MRSILTALLLFVALLFNGKASAQAPSCNIMPGTLTFGERSSELTTKLQQTLDALAEQMQGGSCRVVISGTSGGNKRMESEKAWSEEKSWERINKVVEYMATHHKMDRSRFVSRYKGTADSGQLNFAIASANDGGSYREDEPHAELHKK